MRYTWNRAFANGREAALAGEGPERVLDACARLLCPGSDKGALVEMPLLGAPGYDFLLALRENPNGTGCWPSGPAQPQVQAVADWLASLDGPRPEVFLELDASGSGALAGIHAKVEGRRDLAEGFFRAMGEQRRIEPFCRMFDRLPHDWLCLYVAAFPGRAASNTRLEIVPVDDVARERLCHTDCLRSRLNQAGFTAHGKPMLKDLARLVSIGTPVTLQFDILPDGSPSPTLSLVSSYEHVRGDVRSLWSSGGALASTCLIYEEMGLADGRWRELEDACFLTRRTTLESGGVIRRICGCLPNCTKVTWEKGVHTRAKMYALLESRRVS